MRFSALSALALTLFVSSQSVLAAGNVTITVETKPSGAGFGIYRYNARTLEGTTPATFVNMDPSEYHIVYKMKEGCVTPSPQKRTPSADTLHFLGVYDCTSKTASSSSSSAASSASSTSSVAALTSLRLWHTTNQTEVVGGSTVMVTIGIRNLTKGTLKNVVLSESFDTSKATISRTLPEGGTFNGSIALWNIPQIYANQSWTVTFPLTVNESTNTGESIQLTARVSGDNINTTAAGSELLDTIEIGVPQLPETGSEFVIGALMAAIGVLSFLLTSTIRRRRLVV